jgi:taurine dioxygenase
MSLLYRQKFALRPLTPVFGAAIEHVDLCAPIDGNGAAALRAALDFYGLLVFHDQAKMMRTDQIALARVFGLTEISPFGDASEPEVVQIVHDANRPPTENVWHVDHSFREVPPLGAVLRAIEVPVTGGDTVFADLRAVWRRLPEAIRELLRKLNAVHDIAKWAPVERVEELHAAAPIMTHPAVRVHPATDDEILFVNAAYTTGFVGVEHVEGIALLDYLLNQVQVPEVQFRLQWRPGTVVVWDNRSMQHYAVGDYFPANRVMDRVTIAVDT